MLDRLFVYGTLRRDVPDGMYPVIRGLSRFAAYGTLRGRLLDLGPYPGLVSGLTETSTTLGPAVTSVRGEIHVLEDPVRALERLDDYEGCGPSARKPYRFERLEAEVTLELGETVRSWVYEYRGPRTGKRWIDSGDYARHVRECRERGQ